MKAEIFNNTYWVKLIPVEALKAKLESMLENAGLKVLGFNEHFFENGGYTGMWLLAESHLAVHTFIEENKAYVELSSCNLAKQKAFDLDIKKQLPFA